MFKGRIDFTEYELKQIGFQNDVLHYRTAADLARYLKWRGIVLELGGEL
jgi:hypothetical protein